MRKLVILCGMLGAFSALGVAATVNGTLVNYDCYKHGGSVKACGATRNTDRFMLYCTRDKKIRFDNATNDRTKAAMQSRADRASNPFATKRTPVYASATGGFREGGKFHADTIGVK
jgi:hypothetical protein